MDDNVAAELNERSRQALAEAEGHVQRALRIAEDPELDSGVKEGVGRIIGEAQTRLHELSNRVRG